MGCPMRSKFTTAPLVRNCTSPTLLLRDRLARTAQVVNGKTFVEFLLFDLTAVETILPAEFLLQEWPGRGIGGIRTRVVCDEHDVFIVRYNKACSTLSAKFSVFAVNGDGSAVVTLEGPVEEPPADVPSAAAAGLAE